MHNNNVFIDSNILVYAFSEEEKRNVAEKFLSEVPDEGRFIISYQVINETICDLQRKGFSEGKLREVIENLAKMCEVGSFSVEEAIFASELRESFSLSYWNSHIVASAQMSGCSTLVSEDMQDGQIINGMTIRNIFA
jgi:predicted nucleic acid-binding protein